MDGASPATRDLGAVEDRFFTIRDFRLANGETLTVEQVTRAEEVTASRGLSQAEEAPLRDPVSFALAPCPFRAFTARTRCAAGPPRFRGRSRQQEWEFLSYKINAVKDSPA